ncbi:MAG: hypothetical protein ACRDMV_24885 [Streptosporangiales bacterium]
MDWFIPPTFDLYEFDDRHRADLAHASARRWFSHWDGLLGAPAEEVTLAWSDGNATVVVCTSSRSYDVAGARFRAAHLALGGDELPIAEPGSAESTTREIERIESAEKLWSRLPSILPGGDASAEAAKCEGFAIAYGRLDNAITFMAATGLNANQFRIRKVRDWDAYGVDATTRFPLRDLDR